MKKYFRTDRPQVPALKGTFLCCQAGLVPWVIHPAAGPPVSCRRAADRGKALVLVLSL